MFLRLVISILMSFFNPSKLSLVCIYGWSISYLWLLIQFASAFVFQNNVIPVAGDHFDIDVYKPWEFNATFPIRTVFIPQLIVGLPYAFLKRLSPYLFYFFGLSLRIPYFYVLFPRLFMCMLSFLSDYFLYKICCIYGQNYKVRLVTYASSYIVFTYATRTLTNSVELVLTAALLYFTSQCMAFSEEVHLIS